MKTYTINDYLNGDYETQNKIIRHTQIKMLLLDIFSFITSIFGFLLLEIEVNPFEIIKFHFLLVCRLLSANSFSNNGILS